MIEVLEHELRESWQAIAAGRPRPRRVHVAKLSHDDYPAPESALLVLLFADRDSEPIAVAKVARVPDGDNPIRREAAALERIASRLPEDLRRAVPRLLRHGNANGRAFLLTTALPGSVEMHHTWGARGARRADHHIRAALDWIVRLGEATACGSLRGATWFGFEPGAAVDALARCGCPDATLRRLESRLAQLWSAEWPAGLAHGDYFPGNLLFAAARRLGVVDWMLSEEPAPLFLDPLTYELSFGLHAVQRGLPPDPIERRAVHELAAFTAIRRTATARGLDLGLGSDARLAVLVRGALRDGILESGRTTIARAWIALLAAELQWPARD